MPSFQDVLSAARGLDASERIRLANTLWEEMVPEDWPLPSVEWVAEVQRRSAEYDDGLMSPARWQEVRARARRKAGLDE